MNPQERSARNADTGARIRKRRQVLDWDQAELARRVGVHVNSVQKWESGEHYPARKLGKLERVLGVKLDDTVQDPRLEHIRAAAEREFPGDLATQRRVMEAVERTLRGEPHPPPSAPAADEHRQAG